MPSRSAISLRHFLRQRLPAVLDPARRFVRALHRYWPGLIVVALAGSALLAAATLRRAASEAPTLQPTTALVDQGNGSESARPGYLAYRRGELPPAPTPDAPGSDVEGDGGLAFSASTPELPEEPRAPVSARGGARPTDTPTATPTPTKAPKKVATYQVAAGDTVQNIADKFGVSAETVLWANGLKDASQALRAGQSLTILPVSGVLYTVKKGDTLLGIAEAQKVSPEDIIEANALADPNVLQIDQQLIIPGGRQAPPPAPVPLPGGFEHTVVAGETVQIIARRYGVEPATIIRANGLADPDSIRVGQKLTIPGVQQPKAAPSAAPATQAAPPSPPPAEAPKPANKGQEIVAIAARFQGYRYTWGGHAPSTGFDCSGFAWYVCQQAGVKVPMHDLAGQLGTGRTVRRSELLPGDLVFFQNTFRAGLSHVGIYVGGNRFIHAATEATGVRYDSLDSAYWDVRYYGASRPWE